MTYALVSVHGMGITHKELARDAIGTVYRSKGFTCRIIEKTEKATKVRFNDRSTLWVDNKP